MKKMFFAAGMLMCAGLAHAAGQKNVLFILVDDMQKTCINVYGNPQVVSPNIDNLVNNGITFSHTYTNGALCGALSMPSRAMIMTGRGVYQISKDGAEIPKSQITLPELLRQNGYETFGTGKWHADKKSFNRSFEKGDNIFFGGMHSYEKGGHTAPRLHHYDAAGSYKKPFIGKKFSSEMFADATVDFLSNRKRNKPFFAFVAFTSPHDPRNQHPDYGHKYSPDTLDLPVNFMPRHPFDNGELLIRDEVLLPFPRTEAAVKQELAHYYGMISEVDVQIGRIIETLRQKKELDNTIIIFASDNGLSVGRHGLIGKQNLYEHSISVPMLMVVPGKEKGIEKDVDCYLYDIYPTVCDLLDIKTAESVTGKSLLPVIEGTAKYHRNQLFLAYSSIQRALVKDRWKYIIYNVNGKITEQLFDLNTDPFEMVNLANDEKYRFKKEAYNRILKEEMKKNNDCCDFDKYYWRDTPEKISWKESEKLYIYK